MRARAESDATCRERMKRVERMRRKLFTLLAAISLLLCVATVGLIIRSQSTLDGFSFCRERKFTIASRPMAIEFAVTSKLADARQKEFLPYSYFRSASDEYKAEYDRFGFGWKLRRWVSFYHPVGDEPSRTDELYRERVIFVPWWLLLLLSSVLPVATLLRNSRRKARVANGCCRACGYDLRATPERCPECGAVPPSVEG